MPYTPEQNGLVKRKNKFIVEDTQVMLHDQKLPKFLWNEVSHAIAYFQNRVPHQALENKTPEEAFTGVKLDVSHLHIFGCPVYFLVQNKTRKKLDATGKKCTFFCYCENTKAYRIYIPSQRKVEINKGNIQ